MEADVRSRWSSRPLVHRARWFIAPAASSTRPLVTHAGAESLRAADEALHAINWSSRTTIGAPSDVHVSMKQKGHAVQASVVHQLHNLLPRREARAHRLRKGSRASRAIVSSHSPKQFSWP